jgi:ornithine cyclodeaminase/alanine dehydrogenase-like protein (mu-crystallin family)
MTGRVRHLSVDELYDATLDVDAVAVLVDELVLGTMPTARWTPDTLLEDGGTGERCALPLLALRSYRAAALTALAARQLLAAGVVTASVIGSGTAAQLQLMLIARHVPDVSDIAMCPLGTGNDRPVEPRVIDQLDLAGIELTLTNRAADAVFGANLVALAGDDGGELRPRSFAKGAVVVNASDHDLPDDVVEGVDQVYVDDLALVAASAHRRFVRAHLAGTGRPRCHLEADLAQVCTGRHAGRAHPDHVLLVELLGTRVLDLSLASHIHKAALRHGLGVRPTTKGNSVVDQR